MGGVGWHGSQLGQQAMGIGRTQQVSKGDEEQGEDGEGGIITQQSNNMKRKRGER
jgi:hypothetical protein